MSKLVRVMIIVGVSILFLLLSLGMILPTLISTDQLPLPVILILVITVVLGAPVLLIKLGEILMKDKKRKRKKNGN